ncbi:S8 family serine peptidase [Natronomonas marina]|uniref:S8 family serine peptidase n=1 Tax=Natronomonas marina TaxID=2961939 RepID=UPI0020CA22CB|nr:S8 family serine peptidase [Natronomonas marina]
MRVTSPSPRTVAALVLVATLAVVALPGVAVPAAADNGSEDVYVHPGVESADGERELLVGFETDGGTRRDDAESLRAARLEAQSAPVERLRRTDGVTVLRQFWVTNAVLIRATEGVDVGTDLAGIEAVEEIYLNFETRPSTPVATDGVVETETHDAEEDGLGQVNARAAWGSFDTRGANATVAVLDTGVDDDHPDIDLAENGWAEFDASGDRLDTEPHDPSGHGTHVTGVVAGGSASGEYIGVAPDVRLLHGKVLDDGGTFAQIIAGIEWALERDADVISMSFGIPASDDSVYEEAFVEPIRTASESGAVVVTSSGNTGQGKTGSPGNVYDAVAVGAVDDDGEVPGFSSGETVDTSEAWGDDAPASWPATFVVPDVAAPGVDVVSAAPGGGYTAVSGTSAAAPYASGTLALMVSANGSLSRAEAKSVLRESAVHPDPSTEPDDRYGAGVVDAHRAVTAAVHDGSVAGTVETADGAPAVGVVVRTAHGTTGLTDESGRFSIPVPPGSRTVTVDPFGYTAASRTVDVAAGGSGSTNLVVSETVDVRTHAGQPDVVAAGESFDVELEVANLETYAVAVDGERGTLGAENVTLRVDGEEVAAGETVAVENGTSRVTLSVSVDGDATGTLALNHTVAGTDETVVVETGPTEAMADPRPASFRITETAFGETVGADRTLETTAVVENTGDYTDTQSVAYRVDIGGTQRSFYRQVTLSGGETAEVSWTVTFDEFAGGEYDHRIETGDDSAAATFEYLTSEFVVTGVEAPATVTAGETATVSATVENVGDIAGDGTAEFSVGGETVAGRSVDGAPGETATVAFEFETATRPTGVYEYVVGTPDDAVRDDLLVEEPPITAYAAEDGTIGNEGLREASEDWRVGHLSTASFRGTIDEWRTNATVTG